MKTHLDRRLFLGAAGAGVLFAPGRSAKAKASERVRVAVIGLKNRGTDHARMFAANPGSEVVAVCDVDDAMFAKPVKAVEKAAGKAPAIEKDFRRLLDDKTINAVTIATPDHWHALLTVLACQAGKDVYVEKPASHDVVEGRRMVEAARKYNRIVQLGTQRRSAPYVQEAIERVRSGSIGKVGMARAWTHQKRHSIGHGHPGSVPPGLDYALWQGPAPGRPYYENRLHYNWHWFWNWGTGELGNNGIHCLDVARWGLGVEAPTNVSSSGGKYAFDDDQETPDTQVAAWEFPGACLVYEHRIWSNHPEEGSLFGIAFYGDKGTLIINEKGWRIEDGETAKGQTSPDGQALHVQNFLDCVKSRQKPNADIEIGHLSTRLCHLGNIAYRTGKKLAFDAAREAFHDAEANALLRANTARGSRCRRRFNPDVSLKPDLPHKLFPMQLSPIGLPLDALDTPAVLIDLDRLQHNIDLMARCFQSHGVAWRPHAKAFKCPAIAHLLRRSGAIGVTVAKVSEAEVMAAGGIDDILVAHLVVGSSKVARLAAIQHQADVKVTVDHPDQVAPLGEAAQSAASHNRGACRRRHWHETHRSRRGRGRGPPRSASFDHAGSAVRGPDGLRRPRPVYFRLRAQARCHPGGDRQAPQGPRRRRARGLPLPDYLRRWLRVLSVHSRNRGDYRDSGGRWDIRLPLLHGNLQDRRTSPRADRPGLGRQPACARPCRPRHRPEIDKPASNSTSPPRLPRLPGRRPFSRACDDRHGFRGCSDDRRKSAGYSGL